MRSPTYTQECSCCCSDSRQANVPHQQLGTSMAAWARALCLLVLAVQLAGRAECKEVVIGGKLGWTIMKYPTLQAQVGDELVSSGSSRRHAAAGTNPCR